MRSVAKVLPLVLALCSIVTGQSTPPSTYNANTSRINFTEPALTGVLDLGQPGRGAGYRWTEPQLSNAVIVRCTDQNTDPSTPGRNFSAPDTGEVRAWNITSTRFYLLDLNGGGLYPYSWDGTNCARMGSTSLPTGGLQLTESSMLSGGSSLPSWSGKNGNVLWGIFGLRIRTLNFSSVTSSSTSVPVTDVVNLSTVYSAVTGGSLTGSLCSLGVSGVDAANDFVATAFDGGQDTWKLAFWYDSATGRYKVLDTFSNPMRVWDSASPGWVNNAFAGGLQLHNVKVAQDGRTVELTPTGSHQTFWDTQTDTIRQSTPSLDGGHRSGGYGNVVTQYANGTDAAQWMLRAFTDLTNPLFLVQPTLSDPSSVPQYPALNPVFDGHVSWHNARSAVLYPVFDSTSRVVSVDASHPWRPYDNEIVAIRTDGTRGVFRIAHHFSKNTSGGPRAQGYYDNAFGQVSPDGRFFVYGSNHGMTLSFPSGINPNTGASCAPCQRIDAFVVILPVSGSTVCRWNTTPPCQAQ